MFGFLGFVLTGMVHTYPGILGTRYLRTMVQVQPGYIIIFSFFLYGPYGRGFLEENIVF